MSVFLNMENEFQTSLLITSILKDKSKSLFVPFIPNPKTSNHMEMVLVSNENYTCYEDIVSSWGVDSWGIPIPRVEFGDERDLAYFFDSEVYSEKKGNLTTLPPTPHTKKEVKSLDLILMPGLLFSESEFTRLGQGKGFYDVYLERAFRFHESLKLADSANSVIVDDCACASTPPKLVALAYREQLVTKEEEEQFVASVGEKGRAVPCDQWDFKIDGICSEDGVVLGRNVKSRK